MPDSCMFKNTPTMGQIQLWNWSLRNLTEPRPDRGCSMGVEGHSPTGRSWSQSSALGQNRVGALQTWSVGNS